MTTTNIQLLLTVIVTISTAIYSFLTIILVNETKKLREVQTEPDLITFLQPFDDSPAFLEIVVKNIGGGTAYNVRWVFDYDTPLIKERETRIDKQNFFTIGVDYFAPGQIYHSLFGIISELTKKPEPPALILNVNYENKYKRKYSRIFAIDPNQISGRSYLLGHGPAAIVDSLKKIDGTIANYSRDIVNAIESQSDLFEQKKRIKPFNLQKKLKYINLHKH